MQEDIKLSPKYPKYAFLFVLLVGIMFYFVWGITGIIYYKLSPKDAFIDLGSYSLSIVLILFGLVGFLLYRKLEKSEKEKEKN